MGYNNHSKAWRRLGRGALMTMAGVALCAQALPAWAESSQCHRPVDRYQAIEHSLNETYRRAEETLERLPREDWSLATRQQAIGNEAEALFRWVRDETRWLPYQGALRGARGTLIDRQGSHLDRALLLGGMLDLAGHRVRIVRAILDERAVQLLEGAWLAPSPNGRALPQASLSADDYAQAARQLGEGEESLRRRVEAVDRQGQEMAARVGERSREQTARLHELLAANDKADDDALGDPSAALADHWWVQIQTAGGWQDLDPALAEHRPGQRLHEGEVEVMWVEEIAEDQWHRVSLEVVAERLESGRLRERTALLFESPAAQLAGRNVVLDIQPLGLPSPPTLLGGDGDFTPEQLPDLLRSREEWLPLLLIDGEPEIQHSILRNGELGDPEGGTGISEAFEEASSLLGEISVGGRADPAQEAPAPELSGVFLRLTVRAPGRKDEIFQRALMDVIDAGVRQRGVQGLAFNDAMIEARALAMLSTTELMAQTHWWPTSYTLARLLHGSLDNRMAALGAVHAVRRDDPGLMGSAIERLAPYPVELIALAHHRRARSPHAERIALTRVNLLSTFERLMLDDTGPAREAGIDIIDNRVEVLPGEQAAWRVRLGQGVFDTVLEAELVGDNGSAVNTSLDFARAGEAGDAWRLATAPSEEGELPVSSAAAIERALERGYWVVMPEPGEGADTWWRVDPLSGDALGMGPDGRGQMVEQILVLMNSIDNAASAVATVQAVWGCLLTGPSAGAMQCCILREGAMVAGNMALGKLSDQWVKIASSAIESKIYLAALDGVFGEMNGTVVDGLMPDPC